MTDGRLAGIETGVLLQPVTPTRRLVGVDTQALIQPPAPTRRVAGIETQVLLRTTVSVAQIVTVGAPTVPVQIRWPDGTWHEVHH